MKKKIIFDASVLVSGSVSGNIHKTGLHRVSYELLKVLEQSTEFEFYLYDIFQRERELIKYIQKEFKKCDRIKVYSKWYRWLIFPVGNFVDTFRDLQQTKHVNVLTLIYGLLKNILLLIEKTARKTDRLFFIENNLKKSFNQCSLYYSTYFPIPEQIRLNSSIKKVYTIHDMIPIIHPEYFSSPFNQLLLKEVVDNIDKKDFVICVSESTKHDLLSYRKDLISSHISVAPLAASSYFYPITDKMILKNFREKYNIPLDKRYLLSLCTIEPRKNLQLLISSFKQLLKENKISDLILVLAGSSGWEHHNLFDEIAEINRMSNQSIILTGFIPENDLAALYSGAFVFIYPSLYEGFGLPPLEAMQCGLPVITSERSSLPEVVADCGILINPENKNELVEAIAEINSNNNLYQTLKHNSIKRAALFNWTTTANILINVLNSSLSSHE